MTAADLASTTREILDARNVLIEALVAVLSPPSLWADVARAWLRNIVLAPQFYLVTALILLWERRAPASGSERALSASFMNDLLWYAAQLAVFFALAGGYAAFLQAQYDAHFTFLTVRFLEELPLAAAVIVAIVVGDFLAWLHHFVRHKVRLFWWFHEVHHSQEHMNLWTEARYHVVEYFIADTIRFVPLFALQLGRGDIAVVAMASAWYARLYHANIRSRFGVLRYVLVTPQSHRIHHSILPAHQDQNFGVLLSVWDRMFGTQSSDDTSYPDTGVVDVHLAPVGRGRSAGVFRAFAMQQLHPFFAIGRWVKSHR